MSSARQRLRDKLREREALRTNRPHTLIKDPAIREVLQEIMNMRQKRYTPKQLEKTMDHVRQLIAVLPPDEHKQVETTLRGMLGTHPIVSTLFPSSESSNVVDPSDTPVANTVEVEPLENSESKNSRESSPSMSTAQKKRRKGRRKRGNKQSNKATVVDPNGITRPRLGSLQQQ